jgi:exodeoxyribonuclease VII large subunit
LPSASSEITQLRGSEAVTIIKSYAFNFCILNLGLLNMTSQVQRQVYEVLETSDPDNFPSRLDDWGVSFLVILDVTALILDTSQDLSLPFDLLLDNIELVSLGCFTILYLLQLWSCTADPQYHHPLWGRLRYAVTPLVLIDLLAILPFYLIFLIPHPLLIEATDLFRLLRLLKLIRYSESLQTVLGAIASKKEELFMTFVAVFIVLIFASSVMYFAERYAQPEAFPSIPVAMWWGVVTLTTVGYGDVYPVTPLGKIFGATLAFTGIGLFALPAGIIASGFSGEIQKRTQHPHNIPLSMPTIPDQAISVSGLTTYLQALLQEDPQLQQVWVIGEVSSANYHRSGIFFTLTDTDGTAALKCVVWKGLQSQLVQAPTPGEQLVVLGSISLFAKRGEYQLTAYQCLPGGEGLQALRYKQFKSRLEAEGLFDPERKRPLPPYPQTIAVVTSPTAAAWGDIQRTLSQRAPGLTVLLSPATVQGETAPASITKAVERVSKDSRAEVLLLARGGGATEDLSCFNDEAVVRAIALCPIPVITGIGHQRDESLADLVADYSTHTPTAAAEAIVPDYRQLQLAHQQRKQSLLSAAQRRFEQEFERLESLKTKLQELPRGRQIERAFAQIQSLRQRLAALDPEAVIKRGYAVVRNQEGQLVKQAQTLTPGEELTIQLSQGTAKVKVTKIEK